MVLVCVMFYIIPSRPSPMLRSARAVDRLSLCSLPMVVAAVLFLAGCGGGNGGASNSALNPKLSDVAALGERIFHDTALSASGRMSCATCHDPAFAHSQSN